MLPRLSIPLRLLLLLAVPLAALLIVSLAGLSSINASGTTTVDLQLRLERRAALDEVRQSIAGGSQALAGFIAGEVDPKRAFEEIGAAQSRIDKALATYMQTVRSATSQPAQSKLKPTVEAAASALSSSQDALMENNVSAVRAHVESQVATTSAAATEILTTLIESEKAATARLISASLQRGQSFFALNIALGMVGLGLALLFGYFIAKSITTPINQITATVQQVAGGKLDARARLNSYDEIGVLGNALDNLLDDKVTTLARAEQENTQLNDSVIALLRAVSRLSQRDLTVRVPVTEDVTGPVADAINQLANETGRVLIEVSRVAGLVATASEQVKNQAESVSAVALDQQTETMDTAEKLTHASERLSEISKLAQHCNELARSASQNTESAVVTVTGTLRGMVDIREGIQETGKRIKRLGERSQEISGIVDIINKIAERTTVLALNASMQAAAAGDAGRGFGVVADEVQRLAESTRNAAGQIGTLIKSMQIETNDTIGTMENAIGQVVEGSKMAEAAGKQIGDTQGATTALVQSVQQIAASSQEQAQLSVTLRDRAHTMIRGGRTTGEQLSLQMAETIHLTDFARLLLESVRVFKLPA